MKTAYLLATGLLFAAVATTKAQGPVELGITGGPTAATLYGNNDVEDALGPRLGFVGGLTFQYNFNSTIGLHTGLLFERKGGFDRSEFDFFGIHTVSRTWVNFDYVNVPILVRASFFPEGGTRLFVNAGPYLGFLTRQSTIVRTANDDGDRSVDTEVHTNSYKAFDVGATFGLGVKIPVAPKIGIGLEARDNVGFMNISESEADGDRLKNNSFNFLASVIFTLP